MTPEQEIWAVALWVEKQRGADGLSYIAEQIGRLALEADQGGMAMWKKVAGLLHRTGAAGAAAEPLVSGRHLRS